VKNQQKQLIIARLFEAKDLTLQATLSTITHDLIEGAHHADRD